MKGIIRWQTLVALAGLIAVWAMCAADFKSYTHKSPWYRLRLTPEEMSHEPIRVNVYYYRDNTGAYPTPGGEWFKPSTVGEIFVVRPSPFGGTLHQSLGMLPFDGTHVTVTLDRSWMYNQREWVLQTGSPGFQGLHVTTHKIASPPRKTNR